MEVHGKDSKHNGKRIVELMAELQSMREYGLLLKVKAFDRSLYIFEINFKELERLLIAHSNVEETIRLEIEGKKARTEDFLNEVNRLLHNFLASVTSLIDHARELFIQGDDTKDTVLPEYEEEKNRRFENNPLAELVKGLSIYYLHVRVPSVSSVRRGTPEWTEFTTELRIDELKKFHNWSSSAKKYLASQTTTINVVDVVQNEYLPRQTKAVNVLNAVQEYYNMVRDFYMWVGPYQEKIHSQEIARVASIEREIARLKKNT